MWELTILNVGLSKPQRLEGRNDGQTQVFNTVPNLDSNISMFIRAKRYTNTCVLERARLCGHSVLVDCFTLSFTKRPQSQWSLLRMKITKSHGFWWKLNKCFTWSPIIQLNAKKKKNPYISSSYIATPWIVPRQAPLSMGILQTRIMEWVAIPSSRGSSQPRDQTQVSHIADRSFTIWATSEVQDID